MALKQYSSGWIPMIIGAILAAVIGSAVTVGAQRLLIDDGPSLDVHDQQTQEQELQLEAEMAYVRPMQIIDLRDKGRLHDMFDGTRKSLLGREQPHWWPGVRLTSGTVERAVAIIRQTDEPAERVRLVDDGFGGLTSTKSYPVSRGGTRLVMMRTNVVPKCGSELFSYEVPLLEEAVFIFAIPPKDSGKRVWIRCTGCAQLPDTWREDGTTWVKFTSERIGRPVLVVAEWCEDQSHPHPERQNAPGNLSNSEVDRGLDNPGAWHESIAIGQNPRRVQTMVSWASLSDG